MPGSSDRAAGDRSALAPLWVFLLPVAATVLAGLLFFWPRWFAGHDLTVDQARSRLLAATEVGERMGEGALQRTVEAIGQVARRSREGESDFVALGDELPKLTASPNAFVRRAVALAMGQARTRPGFVPALRRLLADEDPHVRLLAAGSLAAHEDPSGREVLLAALEPVEVLSPHAGRVVAGAQVGVRMNADGQLLFVEVAGGARKKILAPITGELAWMIESGARVREGERVARLLPGRDRVWGALRALYLVGHKADIARIRAALDERRGLGRDVVRQKNETIETIEERARRGIDVGDVR